MNGEAARQSMENELAKFAGFETAPMMQASGFAGGRWQHVLIHPSENLHSPEVAQTGLLKTGYSGNFVAKAE